MAGRGQPKAITPEVEKTIAELFWLAFTDEQVAFFVGINERTIRRMRVGDYCPAIKKAELKRESLYRKKIWDGRNGWQGAAWFLERKYPQLFSKPEVQLQITNNTLNQLNVQALVVTVEEAKAITTRDKDSGARIDQLFKNRAHGNGDKIHDA